MPSICLVVHEETSASRYYRAVLPVRHCWPVLAREGITLAMPSTGESLMGHDAYIFYRNVPAELFPAVTRLMATGKPVYWDIDDNPHAVPEWSPAHAAFGNAQRDICSQMGHFADRIGVSTEPLRRALGHPDKTHVLPNLVDPADWPAVTPRNDGRCRILWQGTATHEEDLRCVVGALRGVRALYRDRVEIVFAGYCPDWIRDDPKIDPTCLAGWQMRDHMRSLALLRPDIGIAPLSTAESDRAFNVCKSGIKYFEYTMAGAVTVATDLDPYRDAMRGGCGHVCDTPKRWGSTLKSAVHLFFRGEVDRIDYHTGIQQDAKLHVSCHHSWSGLAGRKAWLDFYRRIAADVAANAREAA